MENIMAVLIENIMAVFREEEDHYRFFVRLPYEKVSRSALSKIGNTVADAFLSLINRIVTWIKLAFDWIVKIFLSIFGCMKRVPVKEEHGSVEANLPSRDSNLTFLTR
jgi:hypothetical protein